MHRRYLWLSLAFLLFLLVWILPHIGLLNRVEPGVLLIAAAILYLVLVPITERGLETIIGSKQDRYRISFLIWVISGSLEIMAYWTVINFSLFDYHQVGVPQFRLLTALMIVLPCLLVSTFGGALLMTSIHEGLFENNPPPAEMINQVFLKHQERIGSSQAEPWEKRLFDILFSFFGLLFSSPIWAAAIFLIWIEDPGPVLFIKNSTGKGGVNFHLYKYRTMALEMEKSMALVQSQEVSTNNLRIGRFLRKTALDELPQIINILRGEMSFVGPRPHRTPLVNLYLEKLPEFTERHRVLPGLAGLAQVSGDFYMTPLQKLRFDRIYIKHRSLGFDIRLMIASFMVTFVYRWKSGWNGHLPRWYVHQRIKKD